jgi:hypothetical protein
MMQNWKIGDWAVFDLRIVQITEMNNFLEVSDGSISSGGDFIDRLRPLTLANKSIIESFDYFYKELHRIKGERGFNYPDIRRYFCALALRQIDEMPKDGSIFDKARDFIRKAQEYKAVIDGVCLFR